MPDKDYKSILTAYGFKDELGHPLENCIDFHDLLRELQELRDQTQVTEFNPETEEKIKANLTPPG